MSRGPKLEELDSTLNHELVRLRDEIRTVKGKDCELSFYLCRRRPVHGKLVSCLVVVSNLLNEAVSLKR